MASEWISTPEIAKILEVSERAVYASLADRETADKVWGPGNWRIKPLSRRRIPQVRREVAVRKAAEPPPE